MSYDYNPESDGLVSLGYIDFEPEGCYEWDGFSVYVRTEDNRFFWEDGSGCSCNAPMEYVTKLEDFTSGTYTEFLGAVLERLDGEMKSTYTTPAGKGEILRSATDILTEAVKYA